MPTPKSKIGFGALALLLLFISTPAMSKISYRESAKRKYLSEKVREMWVCRKTSITSCFHLVTLRFWSFSSCSHLGFLLEALVFLLLHTIFFCYWNLNVGFFFKYVIKMGALIVWLMLWWNHVMPDWMSWVDDIDRPSGGFCFGWIIGYEPYRLNLIGMILFLPIQLVGVGVSCPFVGGRLDGQLSLSNQWDFAPVTDLQWDPPGE